MRQNEGVRYGRLASNDFAWLFAPEIVTPGQWRDLLRSEQFTPEVRLVVEMLTLAINDYRQYRGSLDGRSLGYFLSASQWLQATLTGRCEPFSFRWCAEVLDLDPAALQRAILASDTAVRVPRSRSIISGNQRIVPRAERLRH